MTELETLERAKMYIDKLANGINPLNDEPVNENDIINNVRISRCLFYVSGVLNNAIERSSVVSTSHQKKKAFALDIGKRTEYSLSEKPIPISEVVNRLNALVDLNEYKKLNYSQITRWLIEIGAIREERMDGKTKKYPTEHGIELGINIEQRQGSQGIYTVIVYNKMAQQFILDNLDAFCSGNQSTESGEYQGQPWSKEHQACLVELFQKGVPVTEIATTLQRTTGGIRARLKRLGLIENRSDAK